MPVKGCWSMSCRGRLFWCQCLLILLLGGALSPEVVARRTDTVEWLYKALRDLLSRPDFHHFIRFLSEQELEQKVASNKKVEKENLCAPDKYYRVKFIEGKPGGGQTDSQENSIMALAVSLSYTTEGLPAETPGEASDLSPPPSRSPCPFPPPPTPNSQERIKFFGYTYVRGHKPGNYRFHKVDDPPGASTELFLRISSRPIEDVRFKLGGARKDILFISVSGLVPKEPVKESASENPESFQIENGHVGSEEPENLQREDEHVEDGDSRESDNLQVEFNIRVGPAEFSGIDLLLNQAAEFPEMLSEIDADSILEFLHLYEQHYDSAAPQSNPYLGHLIGSGISSQVSTPFSFLRSLAVKRTHVCCNSMTEAEQVVMALRAYILILQRAGIPVAPIAYVPVPNEMTGKVAVFGLQKRYEKEEFSDHILGDPKIPMEAKKALLDRILALQTVCDDYNASQVLAIGPLGRIFSLAIDINYPNFCRQGGLLQVADLMPMFQVFAGNLMPANLYAMDMGDNREQLVKSLSSDPLLIHAFFLCMIYRQVMRFESSSQRSARLNVNNAKSVELARQWREIYEYALLRVLEKPHILWAINSRLAELGAPEARVLREDAKARDAWAGELRTLLIQQGSPMQTEYAQWFKFHQKIQEDTRRGGQVSDLTDWTREWPEREHPSDEYHFVLGDLSENFARLIEARLQKKKAAKRQKKAGPQTRPPIQTIETLDPEKSQVSTGNVVLEEDFVEFLRLMFNLNYQSVASDNDCFWRALDKLLSRLLKDRYSWVVTELKKRILKRRNSQPDGEAQSNQQDPPGWGNSDDLPLVMQEVLAEFQMQIAIMVIGIGENHQPTAVLFSFASEYSDEILQTVLIGHQQIQDHMQDQNLIILANHNLHQYDLDINAGPAIQHWGAVEQPMPEPAEIEDDREEECEEEPAPKRIKLNVSQVGSLEVLRSTFMLRVDGREPEHPPGGWSSLKFFSEKFLRMVIEAMRRHLIDMHSPDLEMRRHLADMHLPDFEKTNAELLSDIYLIGQLHAYLPDKVKPLGESEDTGDMLPLLEHLVGLLDWQAQVGEPWLGIAVIQPALGFSPENPVYSVWLISRANGLRFIVRRTLLYPVSFNILSLFLGNRRVRVFFTNSVATPDGKYLLKSDQGTPPDWWLVSQKDSQVPATDDDIAPSMENGYLSEDHSPGAQITGGDHGQSPEKTVQLESGDNGLSLDMAAEILEQEGNIQEPSWGAANRFGHELKNNRDPDHNDSNDDDSPMFPVNVVSEIAIQDHSYQRSLWLLPVAMAVVIDYARKSTGLGW